MMSALVVSSPGKVIIHGEHAVVYGKPALATSLDLRCYLCLCSSQDGQITLNAPDLQLKRSWSVSAIAQKLKALAIGDDTAQLDLLRDLAGIERGDETPSTPAVATLVFLFLLVSIYGRQFESISGLHVTIISTLPFGAGLGSSAAYSVCLSAAFLEAMSTEVAPPHERPQSENTSLDTPPNDPAPSSCTSSSLPSNDVSVEHDFPEDVRKRLESESETVLGDLTVKSWSREGLLDAANKWGFEAEKLIHGTPSGIDNSISTFGGAMRFQGGNITHLERIPNIEILLINTKVPRSTKKMVSGVRVRHDKFPGVVKPILDSVESVVDTAQQILKDLDCQADAIDTKESYQNLQELFSINHHLLNALGVGHPSLDRACAIAEQFGLGAKLTGGGGGGCAIAVIPPGFSESHISELQKALKEADFECWKTVIGTRGVSLHSI